MKTNPREWKAVCEVCGNEFSYPDFDCPRQPGHHTLPMKTYYHLGAGHIQNLRERRLFAPTLNLKSDVEVRDKVTGMIASLPGLIVHFKESGVYETTASEEQYHLDQHPALLTGQEGREAWEKVYLTPEQQLQKSQARLEDIQRQIKEGNLLLDTVKRQKGGPSAVEVR